MSKEKTKQNTLKNVCFFALYKGKQEERLKKKKEQNKWGKLNINSKRVDLEASSVNNYTKYKQSKHYN